MNYICKDPEITVFQEPHDCYRVDLVRDGRSISRCWIVNQAIAVGRAEIDMGGIAGVGTEEDCRNQGLSRRVLLEAVRFMDYAKFGLTMLYGIPNYYHKFGYASAGPDRSVIIKAQTASLELPAGWAMRALQTDDLPALYRLYAHHLEHNICGARIRPEGTHSWSKLAQVAAGERDDECLVVIAPDGHIAAYAWHVRGSSYHDEHQQPITETFIIGEAIADSSQSADALLAACELWMAEAARKDSRELGRIEYAITDEGALATALLHRDCVSRQEHKACAGCMVRVANLEKLGESMLPEWRRLISESAKNHDCIVSLQTELGTLLLRVSGGEVSICESSETGEIICLSVGDLGQLVMGVMPADDLLSRLPQPPSAEAVAVCRVLFPKRQQNMFLPDHY